MTDLEREFRKLRPDQQLKLVNKIAKEEAELSLYTLAKYFLGFSELSHEAHGEMIDILEDQECDRKLIVMPRGTFKSSIGAVAYPIWRLIKNPNLRILIDSEKYENSKNWVRSIKGRLESKKIIELWGKFESVNNWSEGSITIAQRTLIKPEASVTASGVAAGKTGQHFDLIICDDLNTHENSQTIENREKIWRHFQMNTSILDPGGEIVLIGTRYAVDDCIGHVLMSEASEEQQKELRRMKVL